MGFPTGQRIFARSSITGELLEYFIPVPIGRLTLASLPTDVGKDIPTIAENGSIQPFAAIVASRGRMMLSIDVLERTHAFIKVVNHWTDRRLDVGSICNLHAQLLHSKHPKSQFRDSIVWVDGLRPGDAKLIPGPASGVLPALHDYFDFLARHDIHDWIKLAIGYFQFLMIHPFFDGNGRLSRAIAFIHARRFLSVAQSYALSAALSLHRRALRPLLDEVRRGELKNYLAYWRTLISWSADCVASVARTRERAREEIRIETKKLRMTERVTAFLLDNPIFAAADVIARLNLSPKLVSLYVLALERSGVIEAHREANHSRYYRCPAAIRFWKHASETTASTSKGLLALENDLDATNPTP